jgi:ABC-type thiamine transport system substrate-binding protein
MRLKLLTTCVERKASKQNIDLWKKLNTKICTITSSWSEETKNKIVYSIGKIKLKLSQKTFMQ